MFTWIVTGVAVLSVLMLVWIGARHVREVMVLDPESHPEQKRHGRKIELVMCRLERLGGARAKSTLRVVSKTGRRAESVIKAWYKKAQALDRRYKRMQHETANGLVGSHETRKQLLDDAQRALTEESYTVAEQRLIEYLTLDPKNAEVYERLGIVYMRTRQFEQAKETFLYALTLAPNDASILVYLGELALRAGDVKEAVGRFRAAVALRPTNPKYLDFLIESSILAGDAKLAREGVYYLKEANPENKKIAEFEARIKAL
ncbi:hypothetical protein A3B32_01930 [Candidatus Uhrbacteria bacterium RIFCSPLOWO2_01_FULL_53_9]|uniref:Uncharacterized protein n=3 Tax=Candidatus Uhriibacteriota TaxID=1752732 RepID=A0A1F7UXS7_9BACT|nr:MAG: hypothetical protein A3C17_02745 [Candidatus Uhrbacteria bacterium RIFCSPHIGHO2_02_FULL_53_13]OGL83036.1 MAG: hypothetical protein A3B32_01930 [Candidatus Uhrbacteria bacterium RIFCSPLOWO2_01_FULL_53_9]OGL90109.1 MAG: hypothetical protein A3I45_00355 [Candidatus Uhrbacteria bacterium RIFCSPLOWO2_02_FULL_53_10]